MPDDERRTIVLELFAADLLIGLRSSAEEKRSGLVRYLDGIFAKYRTTLGALRGERATIEQRLSNTTSLLNYT
jgi:hypothetical protein